MHIAFVFSGEQLTDREIRVIRGAHALPDVSIVTIVLLRASTGIVATLERMRANVERRVARQGLDQMRASVLSDVANVIVCDSMSDAIRHSAAANRIVNLAGVPWPAGPVGAQLVFELLWDGNHPEGLGLTRACGGAPRDVRVICRSANGQTRVVQQSALTLTDATPAGDRRNAASRSVALLLRALNVTDDQMAQRPVTAPIPQRPAPTALSRLVGAAAASVGTVAAAVIRRSRRQLWRDDAWEIQYRTDERTFVANSKSVSVDGFKAYRPGYDTFVADPIPFACNGTHAVFFEEFPFATRKGVISCAVVAPDGELGPSQRVLEQPYHLSYPFVFRDGDRVYMVPESSANRTIDLYECTSFPYEWEFRQTLLRDISANDATLYHDGTRWWMFATVSNEGAYAWDELHLYFADDILGAWHAHSANPVKCDARSARPAGPLFMKDGQLLRPTQDCSESYGGAVNICEVQELTPSSFREQIVARLDPGLFPEMKGLHTLASCPGLEVVDVRPGRRMRWTRGTI